MSQRNGFGNGFVLGSIVGGVVGGVLGTILATRKEQSLQDNNSVLQEGKAQFNSEENIELARQGLEDKIVQLNLAIDDIRQQLGSVNNNIAEK